MTDLKQEYNKSYFDRDSDQQKILRDYVNNSHNRFLSIRSTKENMSWAGLGIFITISTGLHFKFDWAKATHHELVILFWIYLIFFIAINTFLRFQLRIRRWAAYRVAGCDWLMSEWMPGSPKALSDKSLPQEIKPIRKYIDWVFPINNSLLVVENNPKVYPKELSDAWLKLQNESTKALHHEWLVHAILWIIFLSVVCRYLLN